MNSNQIFPSSEVIDKLLLGTVFEIGSQKMEVHSVHHAKAQIQWLKASRDSALQAVSLLKDIV